MANMAQSQVTIVSSWTEGNTHGRRRTCVRATLATSNDGTGQGSATNTIPASLFGGLAYIEESTCAITSANKHVPASPSTDGTLLLLFNNTNATDANRADPADYINTTLTVTVKGYY